MVLFVVDVLVEMLDYNQKALDPFLTRGRHKDLDVFYLSLSLFNPPKQTIRNTHNNIIILLKQNSKYVDLYRDIEVFGRTYDSRHFALCGELWEDEHNSFSFDRSN